jgi:hypothetical protein
MYRYDRSIEHFTSLPATSWVQKFGQGLIDAGVLTSEEWADVYAVRVASAKASPWNLPTITWGLSLMSIMSDLSACDLVTLYKIGVRTHACKYGVMKQWEYLRDKTPCSCMIHTE